ncbi:methionyl-tRNA formyltransferase [Candidatus Saccharibacteria bacterium]|nr:methionyl-tRNA formyltransferase [Candidatus Saccharibacteria bacterium]
MSKPSIVFFGAGPVALASLKSLQDSFHVEAVITKPRIGSHKAEILDYAQAQKLPLHAFANKAELAQLLDTQSFQSSVGVVVDYGIIIPQSVIDKFDKGIVNSHFSLLPQWRGADPITFAILSGQKQTGVSLMLIVEKLDEGPLLAQEKLVISPEDTTETLTHKLVKLSNKMLAGVLPKYLSGDVKPTAQKESNVSYSRLLTKADGKLDPAKSAEQLEREVRSYQPWPKSYFEWQGQNLIVTKSAASEVGVDPGKLEINNGKLHLGCKDGSLEILEIQPAGKKSMDAKNFINGYKSLLD